MQAPGAGECDREAPEENESEENESVQLRLEFTGSAKEYYRIWIVNTCLTLLTFGIYSAWAKVRQQRYIYSHLMLDGTPFEYLGRPLPILKGRVIATIMVSVWYCTSQLAPRSARTVILLGILVAPWLLIKSMAFRARSTAYRNIRFEFLGTTRRALGFIYGLGLTSLITVGFSYPWLEQRTRKYLIECTWYGKTPGEFNAEGKHFFHVYYRSGLLGAALGLVLLAISALASPLPQLHSVLIAGTSYFAVVVVYTCKQAGLYNLCWRNTQMGGLFVRPALTFRGLLGLYAINSLAIVATLGMAIPWAMMRSIRYRVERTQVYLEGSFRQFEAFDEPVKATGADVVDVPDFDLAL